MGSVPLACQVHFALAESTRHDTRDVDICGDAVYWLAALRAVYGFRCGCCDDYHFGFMGSEDTKLIASRCAERRDSAVVSGRASLARDR